MKISAIALALSTLVVSGTTMADSPNWEGPYIGLQAGGSWGDLKQISPAYGSVPNGDLNGLVVGGFVGYNVKVNNPMVGFEAGGNWSNADKANGIDNDPEVLITEQDWAASAVVKLGLPINNYLVYGLGGAAWTKLSSQYFHPSFGTAPSASDTVNGWTVGAGVETKLTDKINARVEYRYTDYGKANVTCSICGPTAVDLTSDSVTVGISMSW